MKVLGTLLPASPCLTLTAQTAEDLMTPNPVSVRHDATVREAIELLTERCISAAPVIDDIGRAIGVISVTDILIHDREYSRYLKPSDASPNSDMSRLGDRWPDDFEIEVTDPATVKDLMTPAIFTVELSTSAVEVVQRMLRLQVHHLYVVDDQGTVIGVISPTDILRQLKE